MKTAPVAGDRGFEPFEHGARTSIADRDRVGSDLIQSLSPPLDQANQANTRGLLERVVHPHGGKGFLFSPVERGFGTGGRCIISV